MKTFRFALFTILGIFTFLFANTVTAQSTKKVTADKELILGIPKLSDKTFSMVADAIKETEGLEFVQYCSEHKLILVRYDERLFPLKENVISALQKKNINLPMHIKEGSFEDIRNLCTQ